jgi:signal transduction histidine kinase
LTSAEVAELSHDLRVPLSSITASLEMLEEELGESPEAVTTLLACTMRAAQRMERMLDQRMEIDPRPARALHEVDLYQVGRQLAVDSVGLLESADATLRVGWLPLVHADPDQMYSVLQNLLTNAVKFTRPGVRPRVSISSRPVPSGWRISVTDNGIGIPVDQRLDVFTLFTRANPCVEGHGIGLGSVARIVHAFDGRVGVDEAPRGGAEVWFELPATCDAGRPQGRGAALSAP